MALKVICGDLNFWEDRADIVVPIPSARHI